MSGPNSLPLPAVQAKWLDTNLHAGGLIAVQGTWGRLVHVTHTFTKVIVTLEEPRVLTPVDLLLDRDELIECDDITAEKFLRDPVRRVALFDGHRLRQQADMFRKDDQ